MPTARRLPRSPAVRLLGGATMFGAALLLFAQCTSADPAPARPTTPTSSTSVPTPTPTPTVPTPVPTTAATADAEIVLPPPPPLAEPAPRPTTTNGSSEAVYYKNCAAARAAGAAPLYAGEPGYSAHLDRDGDGVACE